MAEAFAPFIIQRTIRNLTFYCMEGRNFVRKKSSLTRRKVLYTPQFERTRHYAGMMGRASKIGSRVFKALPEYWRQSWMYRSFTGEAFTMLKAGRAEQEIYQVLWERYVKLVVNKEVKEVPVQTETKRRYRKQNSDYWTNKTLKGKRRQARRELTLHYAGLMSQASRLGARLYAQLPPGHKRREAYQYLTGLALKLLKEEVEPEDILAELLPTLPVYEPPQAAKRRAVSRITHRGGHFYFIPTARKRFCELSPCKSKILISNRRMFSEPPK